MSYSLFVQGKNSISQCAGEVDVCIICLKTKRKREGHVQSCHKMRDYKNMDEVLNYAIEHDIDRLTQPIAYSCVSKRKCLCSITPFAKSHTATTLKKKCRKIMKVHGMLRENSMKRHFRLLLSM